MESWPFQGYLENGGIEAYHTVTISGNTITGNSALDGGGIYANSSTGTISNNAMTGNSATAGKGGSKNYSGSLN